MNVRVRTLVWLGLGAGLVIVVDRIVRRLNADLVTVYDGPVTLIRVPGDDTVE